MASCIIYPMPPRIQQEIYDVFFFLRDAKLYSHVMPQYVVNELLPQYVVKQLKLQNRLGCAGQKIFRRNVDEYKFYGRKPAQSERF